QKLLSFTEAAAAALDADRQHAIPARWVESATACREFHPQYSHYGKQQGDSAVTDASREALWQTICRVGNNGDFFYAGWLWWLRRALDWLVGGPGFRRTRRHPDELRVGDAVDAWRVIAMQPGERLTLLMEMKAPGAGVLEFSITEADKQRRVSADAYFHPAGVWGLLYWYALIPFHAFIFRGMTRAIAERASLAGDPPAGQAAH
ncbi:MAG: DUF2867 domain-containing protein, partial [Gammaproteobacteria bacterium]|nr:DUF2867 domain-containing protein [Gammaproteobacteria bacterium]